MVVVIDGFKNIGAIGRKAVRSVDGFNYVFIFGGYIFGRKEALHVVDNEPGSNRVLCGFHIADDTPRLGERPLHGWKMCRVCWRKFLNRASTPAEIPVCCHGCGGEAEDEDKKDVRFEDARTNYADGGNDPVPLCRQCAEYHHEIWDDRWQEYHASLI